MRGARSDTASVYAEPVRGLTPSECSFYHRLPFPETTDLPWQWDLVGREGDYLGGFEFKDKRVLEFGAANGVLTMYMESQGAEVVASDLSPDISKTSWDVLWREGMDAADVKAAMTEGIQGLNNGFWYVHERSGSNAKLVHGTAYETPQEVGRFDVVTMCAILLHLRDPLRALENALQFTDDTILIADLMPFTLSEKETAQPLAVFMPSAGRVPPHGGVTWWHISPELYRRYLNLRGFDVVSESQDSFQHCSRAYPMFQLIARRRSQ